MNRIVAHPLATTPVIHDIQTKLERSRYSPQTVKAYLGQLKIFFRAIHPKDPRQVTQDEIRSYLEQLVASNMSRSTVDQAVNALEFFSQLVFGAHLDLTDFERPRKKKANPVVLSLDEVKQIAVAAENPKHRLMIELAYTAGLRVSEVVEVRIKHIDLTQLKLFVPAQGQDGWGRTTIFSASLKDALARQIGTKDGEDLLFPSERGGALTTRAVAKFFKSALKSSGVDKAATPHSLRHSFSVFMLERGTDPHLIQNLLGLRRMSPAAMRAVAH